MIPAKSRNNIREFIARYFIEDAMPDEPVVDEDVRIIYYDEEGSKLGTPHVTKKIMMRKARSSARRMSPRRSWPLTSTSRKAISTTPPTTGCSGATS